MGAARRGEVAVAVCVILDPAAHIHIQLIEISVHNNREVTGNITMANVTSLT